MNIIRYFRRYLALREYAIVDNVRVYWWETNTRVFARLYAARIRALESMCRQPKRLATAPLSFCDSHLDSGVRRCK